MIPTFEQRVKAWSHPPVDDIGYLPARDLLKMADSELRELIEAAELNRFGGWRNWENYWYQFFDYDGTHDKVVLDYGCGIGIEALQYARSGNDVVLADISRDNVRLAMRVLALHGFNVGSFQITPDALISRLFGEFDVIHCCGVLHHIPEPEPVVEAMAEALNDGGELRLMVYSSQAWRLAVGTEPPEVVEDDPDFERYWTTWDAVGGYADWYDTDRLVKRFGKWFELADWQPLTERGEYLGAKLVKR